MSGRGYVRVVRTAEHRCFFGLETKPWCQIYILVHRRKFFGKCVRRGVSLTFAEWKCEKMNDEKGAKASMGGEPKEGGERKTRSIIKNWKEKNKKRAQKKKK